MTATPRRLVAAAVWGVLALSIVGCTQADKDGLNLGNGTPATEGASETTAPTQTATRTQTPTEHANREAAMALKQYRAFYDAVDRAGADPQVAKDPRRVEAILRPVTTGRQLRTTVNRTVAGALVGEVPYGRVRLRPKVVKLTKTTAVIHDCRDTSERGVKKKGHVVAHGLKQDSAETTMKRETDGVWRVVASDAVEPPTKFCQ